MKEEIHLKRQYARVTETVERERERESYTLENKVLLSESKKYRCKKDSSTILVSEMDTS